LSNVMTMRDSGICDERELSVQPARVLMLATFTGLGLAYARRQIAALSMG